MHRPDPARSAATSQARRADAEETPGEGDAVVLARDRSGLRRGGRQRRRWTARRGASQEGLLCRDDVVDRDAPGPQGPIEPGLEITGERRFGPAQRGAELL